MARSNEIEKECHTNIYRPTSIVKDVISKAEKNKQSRSCSFVFFISTLVEVTFCKKQEYITLWTYIFH